MATDIDWETACNDFPPDLAFIRGVESRPEHTGVTPMPSIIRSARRWAPHAVSVFASAVFLDSLRFKFTDHPKTQEIFGRLDSWASSFGAAGLFDHTGIFSQYVIGTGELFASSLLIAGMLLPSYRYLQALGAAIGLAIMTGAISFHLFTPLGVDPNNDGGGLFMAACMVWTGCATILVLRRREAAILVSRLVNLVQPQASMGVS